MGKACTNYDSSCFSAAPIMSELVCVTSGCKEGGVGIETRGARRIAFCAKSSLLPEVPRGDIRG